MRITQELADVPEGPEREAKIKAIKAEIEEGRQVALAAGGLYVIGSERHEARRIDNQLRGCSGRQGDPGASSFFLSLEDDLMRIFGSERMDAMLKRLGLEEGEAITHPWVSKALQKAQEKVEAHNFDIRKNPLRYDDVMNDQRKVIYEQRIELMRTDNVSDTIAGMRHEAVEDMVNRAIPPEGLSRRLGYAPAARRSAARSGSRPSGRRLGQGRRHRRRGNPRTHPASGRPAHGGKSCHLRRRRYPHGRKSLLLQILDQTWKDHLLTLDHLRQGINLRAYGQRDPLNEYKTEAFALFETMLDQLRVNVTQVLMHLELSFENPEDLDLDPEEQGPMIESRADPARIADEGGSDGGDTGLVHRPATVRHAAGDSVDPEDPATWGKVSRNASCPCGSGRKYKHCHGRLA